MPTTREDITRTNQEWRVRSVQWRKIRDVLEGEEQVKLRESTYLPKPRGQKRLEYSAYLNRASLYAVTDRTLRGLTGLVFRVPPVVTLPEVLRPLENAATSEGFTMAQALREATREVLSLGRYGVMVDMPPSGQGLEALPYLATYKAEDIFRWEQVLQSGRRRLMRVVVREEPTTFMNVRSTVLRELFIDVDGFYKQRIWEEDESESASRSVALLLDPRNRELDFISGQYNLVAEVVPTRNGQPFTEIPFWFLNAYDERARTDKPPMLDLVNMNLAHYRNSADYEQSLFMTAQPTPFIFGVPEEDVPTSIGAGTIWHSQNSEVKVGYLEFNGHGLGPIRIAMQDKETRMAELGARIIKDVQEPNVTAETTRLQTRAETSTMVSGVQVVQNVFQKALVFAAEWARGNSDDVRVSMNQDFIETRLSPEEITSLVGAWQADALSRQTLHENLQRGEIVPADRTLEEEQALIESGRGDGNGDDLDKNTTDIPA